MMFRRRRQTVHLQVALVDDSGRTLACVEYEHPYCVHVLQLLRWPAADGGEIVVLDPSRLRVQARAWKGPAGVAPPLPVPDEATGGLAGERPPPPY